MARRGLPGLLSSASWICRQCRTGRVVTRQLLGPSRSFASTQTRCSDLQVQAAPEIDLKKLDERPARILPASPSYFTGSSVFNDNLLLLQQLAEQSSSLPMLSPDQAPRTAWMTLVQYRSSTGEKVAAMKYAKALHILNRLNKIHPTLMPHRVAQVLQLFTRPSAALAQQPKPRVIDEYGRAQGVGRRKESTARVFLVEGTGDVLINGKNITQALPRLHDRESALWPLKVANRTDKYNVFALVKGGGLTGQAESITLALAKALLVHEPALKPVLRRAGCVTTDFRQVERKKPGHVKARKMPTWVKR